MIAPLISAVFGIIPVLSIFEDTTDGKAISSKAKKLAFTNASMDSDARFV